MGSIARLIQFLVIIVFLYSCKDSSSGSGADDLVIEPLVWDWVVQPGSYSINHSNDVFVNNNDEVFFAGGFEIRAQFGDITVQPSDFSDSYIAKYTAEGNVVWATRQGAFNVNNTRAVKAGSDGKVYTAGGGNFYSTTDFFVQQFSTDGEHEAFFNVQADGSQAASDVAVDEDGNVYIIGTFLGRLSFNESYDFSNGSAFRDIFVAKYNSQNEFQWAVALGRNNFADTAGDIDVDANGNVYITGQMKGFGYFYADASQENIFDEGKFAAKLDGDTGDMIWRIGTGGLNSSETSMAVDNNGNIYVSGVLVDDPNDDVGHGNLVKLTTNGEIDWTIGGNIFYADDLTVNRQTGEVSIIGFFIGEAQFNDVVLTESTFNAAGSGYLLTYSSKGNIQKAKVWPLSSLNDRIYKIHMNNSGILGASGGSGQNRRVGILEN